MIVHLYIKSIKTYTTMKTMKTISLNLKYYFLFGFYYNFVSKIEKLNKSIKRLIYNPVYYSYFSRDCDMCEESGVSVFYGSKKAFEAMTFDFYNNAEGSCSIDIISKSDYLENIDNVTFRDRIFEAYENGNGTSIYC